MSRCFPFPPPGFEKKHDPLVESIKLQKERERAKERKKEKRREKKERKEKSKDRSTLPEDKKNKKRLRDEKSQLNHKDGRCLKTRDEETEQLERSSLTEEHGMPTAQYVCDSPDSSQNSCKRKKLNEIDISKSTQAGGLRIKLPLPKQRNTEPSTVVEIPCTPVRNQKETALGTTSQQGQFLSLPKQKETALHTPAQQRQCLSLPKQKAAVLPTPSQQNQCLSLPKQEEAAMHASAQQRQCSSSSERKASVLPTTGERSCLSVTKRNDTGSATAAEPCFSGRIETTFAEERPNFAPNELTLLGGFRGSGKSRRKEAKFRDLILNWNPEPLQVELLDDDQEWLLEGRRQHPANAMEIDNNDSNHLYRGGMLPSWPPRASLLPEAGVHALPFVIPF